MGVEKTVGYGRYPEQGALLGVRVAVCFHYDPRNTLSGVVVRDDVEPPLRTIIRLDDGRYVLSTECQYSPRPGGA